MAAAPVHLSVQNVSLSFGGIQALTDVSFDALEGEILAIIGPNGAGKTSLLNCVNNFYHPDSGQILFEGHDLTRLPPHRIAPLGIARTFQNIALYIGLSTLDNLMAARHVHMSPQDAAHHGVKQGDLMKLRVGGRAGMTFDRVEVRIGPDYRLDVHLDTDEANACGLHLTEDIELFK